jgi:hypothetical protein
MEAKNQAKDRLKISIIGKRYAEPFKAFVKQYGEIEKNHQNAARV